MPLNSLEPSNSHIRKTLICVELPTQIDTALKNICDEKLTDYLLLALTPHVEYELEKRQIPCKRPEDYYSEYELNQLGLENLGTLNQFVDLVDQKLQTEFRFLKQYCLRPANLSWYNLKILFNSISVRTFILAKIIEIETPISIRYFATESETIESNLYFKHESAWSRTISSACSSLNISETTIGEDTDPTLLSVPIIAYRTQRTRRRQTWRKFIPKAGILILKQLVDTSRLIFWLCISRRKQIPTILILEKAYSLKLLMQNNHAKTRFRFLYWNFHNENIFLNKLQRLSKNTNIDLETSTSKQHLIETSKDIWGKLRNDPDIATLLKFSGIECTNTLDSRLTKFFSDTVPQIVNTYISSMYLVELTKPKAIVAATMGSYLHQTISLAASQLKSPFIVYRHGDCGGHVMMESMSHPVIERLELQSSDYVLGFGDGDVMYLGKANKTKAQVIPIGSAVLDNMHVTKSTESVTKLAKRYGLDPEKKTVIYVPTTMDGNLRIIPYRSQSPSRRFSIEREIIDIFSKHPQIQFILKFPLLSEYPFSATARLVRDLNITNCFIITDAFMDLIPIADMFVTDYTSTNFIEMLTTNIPILVCGHEFPLPWNPEKWHPDILDMWRERVEYCEDLSEFKEKLDKKLAAMDFETIDSTNTLLKLFGTHRNDGLSLERAVFALDQICSGTYTAEEVNTDFR